MTQDLWLYYNTLLISKAFPSIGIVLTQRCSKIFSLSCEIYRWFTKFFMKLKRINHSQASGLFKQFTFFFFVLSIFDHIGILVSVWNEIIVMLRMMEPFFIKMTNSTPIFFCLSCYFFDIIDQSISITAICTVDFLYSGKVWKMMTIKLDIFFSIYQR